MKEIQAETSAVRSAVEEQREKLDKTTSEVDAAVSIMGEGGGGGGYECLRVWEGIARDLERWTGGKQEVGK